MLRAFPEVASVFGKVGRAETATDPAPLTMVETTVRLRPKEQWRTSTRSAGTRAGRRLAEAAAPAVWPEERP